MGASNLTEEDEMMLGYFVQGFVNPEIVASATMYMTGAPSFLPSKEAEKYGFKMTL